MKIAVLFDGAGLARLGLERAGHICTGFELDPRKHHLSSMVGRPGAAVLADVQSVDLRGYDAVWTSPPCQKRSTAIKDLTRRGGCRDEQYQGDYLQWCLGLRSKILWVENVTLQGREGNDWGTVWNAAQFGPLPILQNRNRIIGGRYEAPVPDRPYKRFFPGVCPTIMATEYKGSAVDKCRAGRYYGRALTPEECAHRMGFTIPPEWWAIPDWFRPSDSLKTRTVHWRRNIYEAIGNGVPVHMAQAFGSVYKS